MSLSAVQCISLEHTSYHLGQVVDRTKALKGQKFNFCQNGLNEKNVRFMIENMEIFSKESHSLKNDSFF
ncbi:hypothetical protein D0U04_13980 [Bacillus clarus]|uniref:Uncharacterized protein n=1 Tax=Bacillus clarus TaxID=2338372 RepID=A0ABX9KUF2_9BACI|nr:hypothetical protein D0U04_13980 [Bacillus clarus]